MTSPESALERLLRDHRPADDSDVSVAVMSNGHLHTAAWGCSANTLFQACSISKPVAAVAAMVLVDQGRIGLHADLRPRLGAWPLLATGPQLTLWNLLSHTGGLTVRSYPGYAHTDPLPTLSQILSGDPVCNTTGVRPKALPGTVQYCGGGFTVLQFIIENVTGQSFATAMQELVFAPLGMNWARYTTPLAAQAAAGHVNGVEVADGWRVHPEYAAAGLWCTPTDLVKLAAGMQSAAAGDKRRFMSQATAAMMLTQQIGEYGLGFEVATSTSGLRHFEHAGANEGYRSQLIATCDEGLAVAIMTASDQGHVTIHQVQPGIFHHFFWPDVAARTPDPNGPGNALPSFAMLDQMQMAYGGAYDIDATTSVTMTGSRMNWTLTLPDGSQCPLDVLSTTHLVSGYPAVDVTFKLNAGYATDITVQTATATYSGKRR